MSENKIPFGNRMAAEALRFGSSAIHYFPSLGRLVGGAQADNYTQLRWFHARQTSIDISPWMIFKADPQAGNLPRHFKQAATILIDRKMYEGHHDHYPGKQAVAYTLGEKAVMVGVRSDNLPLFETNPDSSDQLAVAMRIGRGTLHAAAGTWSPDNGFVTDGPMMSYGPIRPIDQVSTPIQVV